MSDKSKLRDRLLGVSSYMPPKNVQSKARFKSADEYKSFLAETREGPDAFWMKTAESLIWQSPPTDTGGPGDWFKGGELNIETNCLGGYEEGGSEEELLLMHGVGSMTSKAHLGTEIRADVEIVASQIASWGLEPGDNVLVAMSRTDRALVALLACLKMGLTCVPMDAGRSQDRILRRNKDADCKGAIVDPASEFKDDLDVLHLLELTDDLSSIGESVETISVSPMHPAFVLADSAGQLFTLPTAGFLAQAVSAYKYLLEGRPGGDAMWLMMPFHYASFLSVAFGAMVSKGQIGVIQTGAIEEAEDFVKVLGGMEENTVIVDTKTLSSLAEPTMKEGFRPLGVGPGFLVIDGELVEPRVWAYVRKGLFDGKTHIVQMLSRPESGGFVAGPNLAVTPVRSSSVCLPAPGIDLTVVHTDGSACDTGEGGLLCLNRAIPGLAIELQELDTPLAIQVKARQDQAGYFWPMGEVKIERSKKSVTIPELEAMIVGVQGVDMAAVIRHREADGDLKECAFIKPTSHASDDLVSRIQKEIVILFGDDAVPERFKVVKHLPYSRTGKLLRSVLRRFSKGQPLSQDDISLISDEEAIRELRDS